MYNHLAAAVVEVKVIGKYSNKAIQFLECQVQIVAAHTLYLFACCYYFKFYFKVLIITNRMPTL